jgi:pyochelin biosynthesis protein PchC
MRGSGDHIYGAWFKCHHPRPRAKLRLVCFPHAGGAASFFHTWGGRLAAQVELLATQYPGREDRISEPCIEDMDQLADAAAAALAPALDRPVALFGHSMGAAVAYEVARRLERRYRVSPVRLFVSGHPAPHYQHPSSLHLLDDEQLAAELRRLDGTSELVLEHEELRALVFPIVRSDYRLIETYRTAPGPRLECPVVALLSEDDPEVTLDEARAWRSVTHGNFEVRVFPGNHFYLVPHEPRVIDELLELLDVSIAEPSWPSTP